jgi:hypothetical protein
VNSYHGIMSSRINMASLTQTPSEAQPTSPSAEAIAQQTPPR